MFEELMTYLSRYVYLFKAKREELLQCAQNAIAGLKVNAEMLRLFKIFLVMFIV